MKRLAVVIGVNVVRGIPGLARLRATDDARRVAEWFQGEGFEVLPFIDETEAEDDATVAAPAITAAIRKFLRHGDVQQVVVYFSGHGLHNGSDVWLLGDAGHDPAAAINLVQSLACARALRVDHVVFIGDACRTVPPNVNVQAINGQSLFPTPNPGARMPKVDQFHAVPPGYAAIERAEIEDDSQFRGLFTQALMDCFVGPPAEATLRVDGIDRPVLPNRRLELLLPDKAMTVYRAQRLVSARWPHSEVPSPDTAWMARIAAAPARVNVGQFDFGFGLEAPDFAGAASSLDSLQIGGPGGSLPPPRPSAVARLEAAGRSERARQTHFETAILAQGYKRGGLVVLGSPVAAAKVLRTSKDRPGGTASGHAVDGPWLDLGGAAPCSVLIEFPDGCGAIIALYRNYTTIVTTRPFAAGAAIGTCIESLSYRHCEALMQPELTAQLRARQEEAGRLLSEGGLTVKPEEAAALAETIRAMKAVDPTLGVLAAYAYFDAGLPDEVASVAGHMRGDLAGTLPFDVELLLGGRKGRRAWRKAYPATPMLTRGWPLLELQGAPEDCRGLAFAALRPHLAPTPWTSFTRAGLDLLKQSC